MSLRGDQFFDCSVSLGAERDRVRPMEERRIDFTPDFRENGTNR